jgi:tRNA pseudouridine38-40 synthase
MKRYVILIQYRGDAFHGWASQPNAFTVQECLEDAFKLILGQKVEWVAAGRTDTGVHAEFQCAHADIEFLPMATEQLVFKLNRYLPPTLSIGAMLEVSPDFHARFSALSRTYAYRFIVNKQPLRSHTHWHLFKSPDWNAMQTAAQSLFDAHDFASFCKSNHDAKTTLCQISRAEFIHSNAEIVFYIQADRFLRNMVRAIVGTLVEVGYGKRSLWEWQTIIEQKDRRFAGVSAPAHGLSLIHVEYPQSDVRFPNIF